MKIIKRLLLALLILVVILVGVAYLLPQHVTVERSQVINAPKKVIYTYISDFRRWPEWTVWNRKNYSDMEYEYNDIPQGKGAECSWTSKEAGNGRMVITETNPQQGIKVDLFFEGSEVPSKGEMTMKEVEGGIEVRWSADMDMGMNPISRYFGLVMDRMLGSAYETGLINLKNKSEHVAKLLKK